MDTYYQSLETVLLKIKALTQLKQNKDKTTSRVILFITKFPPVIGGVSTLEYWRAFTLAELGYTVLVVTNCMEDEGGYIVDNEDSCLQPHVNSEVGRGRILTFYTSTSRGTDGQIKRSHQHIPFNDMSTTKLYGLAKNIIKKFHPMVVYSGYLEPYGLIACLLSREFLLPHVLCFAGSDFTRLISVIELNYVYREVFANASIILSTWDKAERLIGLGAKPTAISIVPQPVILPYTYYYKLTTDVNYTVGIYGKCGKHKKIAEIIKGVGLVPQIQLNCMTNPENREYLLELINYSCPDNCVTMFAPRYPWNMSDFLRSNRIMFFIEEEFDVEIHSPIAPIEAGLCGVCIVLSESLYTCLKPIGFKENENCIVIYDYSPNSIARILSDFIANINNYIEIGICAANSLKSSVNKNFDIFEKTLYSVKISKNNDLLYTDYIVGAYYFFKNTITIWGENNIISIFNICLHKKLDSVNILQFYCNVGEQILITLNEKCELSYIEKDIVEMECLKVTLFSEQDEINRNIFDMSYEEQLLSNTNKRFKKIVCLRKITLASDAYEILQNRNNFRIRKKIEQSKFILCKNNFELMVFDDYNRYIKFLYDFDYMDEEQITENKDNVEKAIEDGFIVCYR